MTQTRQPEPRYTISIRKTSISADLFNTAFAMFYSSFLIFGCSTIDKFMGISANTWLLMISGIASLMLVWKIVFLQKYTASQIIAIILLTAILLISFFLSGDERLLVAFLFIIAAKDMNIQTLGRLVLTLQIIIIPMIIILALTDVIPNNISVRETGRVRQGLGFNHPNNIGAQVLQFCVLWVLLRYGKMKWYDYAGIFVISVFIREMSDSRTAFYLAIILMIVTFLYTMLEKRNKTRILNNILKASVILVPVFMLAALVTFEKTSLWYTIDEMFFSRRIAAAYSGYSTYGFSVLGQRIQVGAETGFTISTMDNAYSYVAVSIGLAMLLILVTAMYLCTKRATKEKNAPVVIIMFVYSLYGLMEGYIYTLPYNVTLLLLSNVLYSSNIMKVKSEGQ